jgi:methylthioribose-1-phosphate isomerase
MSVSNQLQSLVYERGHLRVVDQLLLPLELQLLEIRSQQDAWRSIREMRVRGAPLIGLVAALGLAVELMARQQEFSGVAAAVAFVREGTAYLRSSRPTAAPLFIVMDQLDALAAEALEKHSAVEPFVLQFVETCEGMLQEDLNNNRTMGDFGADYIMKLVRRPKVRVLTICNTGSLATAGHGTALGVIRTLFARGQLEHVYACETRPYNQGARLTAFEILHDKLPGTLIPDSSASALMSVKGIDVVIVGGDRVTANGGN